MKRPPTFIIAGAPRSGTTWLYHLFERHPDVYMAKPVRPEPKFFLIDELYERGFDYYLDRWFADTLGRTAIGEKTTNYLESAVAAERIHTHLPDVQLVFILREPVERAYSNWAWSRMNGMEAEDFLTALRLEEQRERAVPDALRYARPHAYFSRGRYADLLEPFLARFPRRQILCLHFGDIQERPGELAARVHRFLRVAPRPSDADGLAAINSSEQLGEPLAGDMRAAVGTRYCEANRRLGELLGPDFAPWTR